MSNPHNRRQSSLTLDQKVGAQASERYWPMRHMLGKDSQGNPITREAYVDMHSHVGASQSEKLIHFGENGWNDTPPDLPSGDPGKAARHQPPSQQYRRNYAKIDWNH